MPDQELFLSPTTSSSCREWPAYDGQIIQIPGNSFNSIDTLQWEAASQEHWSFDRVETTSDHTTVSLATESSMWYFYQQQHVQPPQSGLFSPPAYIPTAVFPISAFGAVCQLPHESEHQTEPAPRTTVRKKTRTKEKPAYSGRSTSSQQRPQNLRAGAQRELLSASSSPCDKNIDQAVDEEEGLGRDMLPRPEKRKPHRVKNLVAAKRYREKTKQYETSLVAKKGQVTRERMYLDSCVTALKNEVLTLKNQILQHGDCDCDLIQVYIARAASALS
ncbi:transcription factor Atf21 (bZIP transcription factor) [Colletotrichum tofieldiae]|uniref:Transcription factor Atf21 (BZIP transcription factor) n=1 Tax=Colletotrichum tofieldiae TaxID=708197 RepID=A0A166N7H3_9PEZI|nr:transcription factor Atf21 (bZIP transcription factor) [Colletotrichum tofieldiae]